MPHVRRSLEARLSRHVLGEREHLVGDVGMQSPVDVDVLVREEAVDPLRRRPPAEADAAAGRSRPGDDPRLEEALSIHDEVEDRRFL